ncbi:MAG TPA: hypothetical protein VGE72_13525 [Azospirillum sp.]
MSQGNVVEGNEAKAIVAVVTSRGDLARSKIDSAFGEAAECDLQKLELVNASISRCNAMINYYGYELHSKNRESFVKSLMEREGALRGYLFDGASPLDSYRLAVADAEYFQALNSSGSVSRRRLFEKIAQNSVIPMVLTLLATVIGYTFMHISQNRAKSYELMFTERHSSLKEARRLTAEILSDINSNIPIFQTYTDQNDSRRSISKVSLRNDYAKMTLISGLIGVIPPHYGRMQKMGDAYKEASEDLVKYIECVAATPKCTPSLKALTELMNEINAAILDPDVYV